MDEELFLPVLSLIHIFCCWPTSKTFRHKRQGAYTPCPLSALDRGERTCHSKR